MALINCPECGKEISDKAISCPNCGVPLKPTFQNTINQTINNSKKIDLKNVIPIIFFVLCMAFFVWRFKVGYDLVNEYSQDIKNWSTLEFLYLTMCAFTFFSVALCFVLFLRKNEKTTSALGIMGGLYFLFFVLFIHQIIKKFQLEGNVMVIAILVENIVLFSLFLLECVIRIKKIKKENNIPYLYSVFYCCFAIGMMIVFQIANDGAHPTIGPFYYIWLFDKYVFNFNLMAGIMSAVICGSNISLMEERKKSNITK